MIILNNNGNIKQYYLIKHHTLLQPWIGGGIQLETVYVFVPDLDNLEFGTKQF